MTNRKDYQKAWREAHKEQVKANKKAWYEANKEQHKASMKAYYQAHKDKVKAASKAYYKANKEERQASMKAWREANKEQYKLYQKAYQKAYRKSDINSLGQTKQSIRMKSISILKQMNLHIDGYEIHHCFGYEDPSKFIYISKSLHLKIHAYLKEHNIDAGKDHWMAIRDIVNSTDEFMYIKA